MAEGAAKGVLVDKLVDFDGGQGAGRQTGVVEDISQSDGVHQGREHADIVGRDRLDAVADDLIAADVVAAANHDDDFGAATQGWFDLFGDPAGASGVEAAGELALKLLAGEFKENAFSHGFSLACLVEVVK